MYRVEGSAPPGLHDVPNCVNYIPPVVILVLHLIGAILESALLAHKPAIYLYLVATSVLHPVTLGQSISVG